MKRYLTLALTFALLIATAALADDDDHSAEMMSDLLERGEVLPLLKILEIVEPVTGPNILEIEVEEEDFGLAYGIYFLDKDGRRHEIYVDPRNGEILMQKLDD